MLVLALLLATSLTVGHCTVCDYEPKSKLGLVVRPFELPKINLAGLTKPRYIVKQLPPVLTQQPLKPNGDLCSCKATVVSPALVPKPAVPRTGFGFDTSKLLQRLQAAVGSTFSSQTASALSPILPPSQPNYILPTQLASSPNLPPSQPNYILPPQPVVPPAATSYLPSYSSYYPSYTAPLDPVPVPSDPVSLQLALKAQRETVKTQEDKLSFGFRSLPIDASIKKPDVLKTDVPEENLLAMNGAVVALQPPREVLVRKDVDNEVADGLEQKGEVEVVAAGKKPTLGEVGFAPAYIVPPPTYSVPAPAPAPAAVAAGSSASYGVPGAPSLPCNEIYPGQVQTGTVPKREQYVLPAPPLPPCNDDEAVASAQISNSGTYCQ